MERRVKSGGEALVGSDIPRRKSAILGPEFDSLLKRIAEEYPRFRTDEEYKYIYENIPA